MVFTFNVISKFVNSDLKILISEKNLYSKNFGFMKKMGKILIKGGRRMRGKEGKFGFSEKDRKRILISHIKEIKNKRWQ